MEVGAPSYASGAHIWKGTAATLKAKPATRRMTEAIITGLEKLSFAARKLATL